MPRGICRGDRCKVVRRLDTSLEVARRHARDFVDVLMRETTFRRKAEELGLVDPVTGAYNKQGLQRRFGEEVGKATRHKRGICLLSVRIDSYAELGSRHGEKACDRVLRCIASTVASHVRSSDTVHRIDGEEFAVLLTETQSIEHGCIVAERIRKMVEALEVDEEKKRLPVTASIGVAAFGEGMGLQELMGKASVAGAKASESGKNRVFVFMEEGARPARELFARA